MSFIPRLMGIMPFGIGLTVLFFIWFGDVGPFGGAPLIFRVFASFVALVFVLTGVMFFSGPSLLKGQHQNMLDRVRELSEAAGHDLTDSSASSDGRPQVNYSCPNCGSDLGEDADVSPSGDAKCDYCKRWFNIHREG
jgi:uncharacterized protein YjeT (DUF2065 family)